MMGLVTKSLHLWGQNPELRLQHLRNHNTVLTVLSEEVAPDEENGQKYIITRKRTRIPALRVVSCQCCRNPWPKEASSQCRECQQTEAFLRTLLHSNWCLGWLDSVSSTLYQESILTVEHSPKKKYKPVKILPCH